MSKSEFILKFALKQQTPLIHFQHDQAGATLRASEVKPKLDRFLLTKLGNGDYEKGLETAGYKGWLLGEHSSLNYKLQIVVNPGDTPVKSNTISADIQSVQQYGKPARVKADTPEDKKKKIEYGYKETVFYQKELTLKLICFIKDLREFAEVNVAAFFLLHNFGTRQNKGFGSFKVISINGSKLHYTKENLLPIIRDNSEAAFFVQTDYPADNRAVQKLEDARMIYGLMKSGFNFTKICINNNYPFPQDYFKGYLLRYFNSASKYCARYKKSYNNDKAFIKQKISFRGDGSFPNDTAAGSESKANEGKPIFARALLGVPGFFEFKDSLRQGKVNVYSNMLDRFPSPVMLKIIDDYIFIIAFPLNPKILNCEFGFTTGTLTKDQPANDNANSGKKVYDLSKSGVHRISTPKDFSISEFLTDFAAEFNDKVTPWGGQIGLREAKHNSFKRIKKVNYILTKV